LGGKFIDASGISDLLNWVMSDDRPIGQSNLGAVMETPSVPVLNPGKTAEMVQARNPVGNPGDLLADICQWCFNPFDYTVCASGWHRTSVEYAELCKALHIQENFQPVICDGCYDNVMVTANAASHGFNNPGWVTGLGHPQSNLALTRGA